MCTIRTKREEKRREYVTYNALYDVYELHNDCRSNAAIPSRHEDSNSNYVQLYSVIFIRLYAVCVRTYTQCTFSA